MPFEGLMQHARTLAANPSAVAMMVAAAQHKSETAAKSEQDAASDATSKAEVSIDLGADGKQVINAKGVPVDDYEANIAKAYEAPQRELATTLQHLSAGLNRAEIQKQLSSYQGRLAAARELGANPLTSRIDSWRINSGRISKDSAIDQVVMQRAAKLAQFQRMTGGIADDARAAHSVARATATGTATAGKKNNAVHSAIKSSDIDSVNIPDIASRAGVDPKELTQNPEYLDAIKERRDKLTVAKGKGRSEDVGKAIVGMKPEDVQGYDNFDSWLTAQEAAKGEFTPSERGRARARFTGYKKEVNDKQMRDAATQARADSRDARADAAAARADEAAARAARSEGRAEQTQERVATHQEMLDRRHNIEAVVSKIEKNNTIIQANARNYAKSLDPDEQAELQKQNAGHVAENQRLRAQLNQLVNAPSAAATSAPSGIVKTATNPKTGEKMGFDGTKWVPLPK